MVKVTADGWDVITNPPVIFTRGRGVLPLPTPEPGGDIELLKEFVNVPAEEFPLLIGFLLGALNPRPPYPILAIYGEHGSGKSTLARVIKELIDPAKPALRTSPDDAKSAIAAARNSWIVAYTNLSYIPPWLSDLLCCLSTDGGYTTRTLYETLGETVFDGKRPVCINGISDLVNRSNLLDRAIQLNLSSISEDERRDEETFWSDFHAAKPKILGALLSAVSSGVKHRHSVVLEQKPRLADFAKWVVAAEKALSWDGGAFLSAYTQNRADANVQAVAGDVLAPLLLDFAKSLPGGEWKGSYEDLRTSLIPVVFEGGIMARKEPKNFPKDGAALGRKIKRLSPNLRALGCDVQRKRDERERYLVITYVEPTNDSSSSGNDRNVPENDSNGCENDRNDSQSVMPNTLDFKHETEPNDSNDGNDGKNPFPLYSSKKKGQSIENGKVIPFLGKDISSEDNPSCVSYPSFEDYDESSNILASITDQDYIEGEID